MELVHSLVFYHRHVGDIYTTRGRQHLLYLMFVKTDWNTFFLYHMLVWPTTGP